MPFSAPHPAGKMNPQRLTSRRQIWVGNGYKLVRSVSFSALRACFVND